MTDTATNAGPDLSAELAPGVHPRDPSVPIVPGQVLAEPNPTDQADLIEQGQRRSAPWSIDNEEALAVNQRSSSQWSANAYTLSSGNIIQLAGKLKGCVSTTIWVPASASHGVVIAPEEGDITQGAGVELDPGDSITLETEAAIWGGVIVGQSTGSCQVVRLYNPPGGGLGLSAG